MNIIYNRIKDLANEKNISLAQVERDLDFSNGVISTWRKSNASQDKILKVANYFNVSTDYLLGRTDNRNVDKTNIDIEEALNSAMSYDGKPITEHDKDIIRELLKAYLDNKD
nr:helix-turn-helix transcriptional regulator [uncultured Ligilactobacillus sp.]